MGLINRRREMERIIIAIDMAHQHNNTSLRHPVLCEEEGEAEVLLFTLFLIQTRISIKHLAKV